MKSTTRARAVAGRQMMICSRYEKFCAGCMKTTEHEFLASNTVQCKECFRLRFVFEANDSNRYQGVIRMSTATMVCQDCGRTAHADEKTVDEPIEAGVYHSPCHLLSHSGLMKKVET